MPFQHLQYNIQGPSALQAAIIQAHGIPAPPAKTWTPVWTLFRVHRNGEDIGDLNHLREVLCEIHAAKDQATADKVVAVRKRREAQGIQGGEQTVSRGLATITRGMNELQQERNEGMVVAAELYKLLAEVKGNLGGNVRGYYDQRLQEIANTTKHAVWAEVTGGVEGERENNEGEETGYGEEREEE